jgi:hypothetical protein
MRVVDITARHLEIVKHPKHGFGGHMNPCIDCHTLMLRITGEMLEAEGAAFIVTGEVLGQRPMSQNRRALSLVARESGFEDRILRPLSAKRLPVTVPEAEGWVQRDALMGFSGRSRKPQMALAQRLGITSYPSPAGGCLLTDGIFSGRLKDLLAVLPHPAPRDLELLKVGRHLRIGSRTKLVVGRNKVENQVIQSLAHEGDPVLTTPSVPGPIALALGELPAELEELAASITASYSDADEEDLTEIRLVQNGEDRLLKVQGREKETFKGFMI